MARGYSVREGSAGSSPVLSVLAKALEGINAKSVQEMMSNPDYFSSQKNWRINAMPRQQIGGSPYVTERTEMIAAYKALDKIKTVADLKRLFDPSAKMDGIDTNYARAYAQRIAYDAMKASGEGFVKADLDELRERHRDSNVEYYYEIDSDGNIIYAVKGGKTGVEVPVFHDEIGGDSKFLTKGLPNLQGDSSGKSSAPVSKNIEGTRSWHNHPKETSASGYGFPPSHNDLNLYLSLKNPVAYVEGAEGRYTVDVSGLLDADRETQNKVRKDFQSTWDAWKDTFTKYLKQDPSGEDMRPKTAALIEKMTETLSQALGGRGKITFTPSPDFTDALAKHKAKNG